MNIFVIYLFPLVGLLGKRMLNIEALKCHEDLITLESYVQLGKTMDNKFFICENINIHVFGYLGAWWGGGLQYSDWVHLGSHLPSLLIIISCQIKKQSDKNLLNHFFRGHVGPLHKIQGVTKGTKMSTNADLITMETYYNKMKQFENRFFIYGENVQKCIFWAIRQ